MITQWVLSFSSVPGHPLYPDSAYRLYAFLLEQLPNEDACWLHEIGGGAVSQHLRFSRENQSYRWTVNILSDKVDSLLRPVLEKLTEVQIENQHFPIADRISFAITPEEVILNGRQLTQNRTSLNFLTPTAFKQSGRYTIFPQEKLILQSLIARWNEVFPEYPLDDEDAFQALLSGIHITDYQLKTSRFFLKGVKIPGFVGNCILDAKLPLPLLELLLHTQLPHQHLLAGGILSHGADTDVANLHFIPPFLKFPIGFLSQMAYAKMRKPTLLGYILALPYGYTLMGDFSKRNHHQLVSHSQEQLRVLEQPGVFLNQFIRQRVKILLA